MRGGTIDENSSSQILKLSKDALVSHTKFMSRRSSKSLTIYLSSHEAWRGHKGFFTRWHHIKTQGEQKEKGRGLVPKEILRVFSSLFLYCLTSCVWVCEHIFDIECVCSDVLRKRHEQPERVGPRWAVPCLPSPMSTYTLSGPQWERRGDYDSDWSVRGAHLTLL